MKQAPVPFDEINTALASCFVAALYLRLMSYILLWAGVACFPGSSYSKLIFKAHMYLWLVRALDLFSLLGPLVLSFLVAKAKSEYISHFIILFIYFYIYLFWF